MVQSDMHQHTLELKADQRRELERTRDRDKRAYMREYAAALLKIADGLLERFDGRMTFLLLLPLVQQGASGGHLSFP